MTTTARQIQYTTDPNALPNTVGSKRRTTPLFKGMPHLTGSVKRASRAASRRLSRAVELGDKATHMLLYLTKETFMGDDGDAFAGELRSVRNTGLPIVMGDAARVATLRSPLPPLALPLLPRYDPCL